MATNVIFIVQSASFAIDGQSYPFSSVLLHLAVNSIPEIIVAIPPDLKYRDGKTHEIDAPELKDVEKIMKHFYDLIEKDATGSLSITLTPRMDNGNGAVKAQTLSVSNWILADVSIGSANTTSGFGITCKLRHPVYNLVRNGTFAGCLDATPDYESTASSVQNIVDASDKVLKDIKAAVMAEFRDAPEMTLGIPHAASYQQVQNKFKDLLDRCLAHPPSEFLNFDAKFYGADYKDLPLGSIMSGSFCDMTSARDMAMMASVTPDDQTSVWDTFLAACGLWGCTVIPTYKGKLTVTPTTVWGPLKDGSGEGTGKITGVALSNHEIASVTLPAYDANPVLGVKIGSYAGGTDITNSTHGNEIDSETNSQSEISYMPTGNLTAQHGRVHSAGSPPWLSMLLQFAASLREIWLDANVDDPNKPAPAGQPDLKDFIYKAQCAFACYLFQILYKESYSASVSCPLLLAKEGVDIIPGMFARIKGINLDGYITTISHEIDLNSCIGLTKIGMSYCRPPGGYKDVAEEGDKNPLYL